MSTSLYNGIWCISLGVVVILFIYKGIKTNNATEIIKLIPSFNFNIEDISDLHSYNHEVARIFFSCAINTVLCMFAGLISRQFGAFVLLFDLILGVPFIVRRYRKVISRFIIKEVK